MSTSADDGAVRSCHVEPSEALHDAAPVLKVVASLIEAEDIAGARLALLTIDAEECDRFWREAARAGLSRHSETAHHGRLRAKRRNVTRALKYQHGERDGWRCRYCGLRVVAPEFFRTLQRLLPNDFPMAAGTSLAGTGWPIQRVFDASPDHVEPVSAGGLHELDNMVTSCGACNYQMKGDCTLDELGLAPPPPPAAGSWNGLVGRPRIATNAAP